MTTLGGTTALRKLLLLALLFSFADPARSQVRRPKAPKGPSSTHSSVSSDFAEAQQLVASGMLEQAAVAAKRGLELSPKSVTGLNLLGIIYHQQGHDADAVAVFKQALSLHPQSVDTLNNLATGYAAQNQAKLAEKMFRKSLRLQPANRTANYNLALLALTNNRPEEAISHLVRVSPPDVATRLSLVRAYLESGMIAKGLRTAEALSRDSANDPKIHFSLGVLLGSHRQYPPAVHELEVANAQEPGTFEILHDLAQGYLLVGRPLQAQQTLNEVLKLQPDSANTLYLLAQAAADQQQDVDALELLVRARKIAPTDTSILFLMARLSMKQSFFEDAIELLNEGLKIDPRRADFYAALGESYFTVGKVDKAMQEFKTLIALDPSPRSYAFMGLCYRHLGQYDAAKRYFNQGLNADPKNLPALFNLGFIAKKQLEYVQAENYLDRALHIDPNYADALFELGSLKMEQRKFDEAIPLLRRCSEVSPRPSGAYYKLALAERSAHQLEASQRDMNVFKTLSKNPQPGPYPLQHFFDYVERRSALSAQQKNETDLRQLQAEVQQHPDRPRSLHLLAEAYLKLNRTNDAIEVIKRLDDVSGGDFRTNLSVGVLLGQSRLYPEAIHYFQAAIEANPGSDEAKYNLADAYFQSGEYANALQSLLSVSSDGQKDSSYSALIGDVYARLGRMADAIQYLQQATVASPDNDQYCAWLALAYLRADRADGAQATVQDGLARIPDSGTLHWVAGVVAVAQGSVREAEAYFVKAQELMPTREIPFMSLGILYYEAGRIDDARQVLLRCMEMFPHGTIDAEKISRVLDAASQSGKSSKQPGQLSQEARREFYELTLGMADQDR